MARGFVTRRSFRGGSVQRRTSIWLFIAPTSTLLSGPSTTVLLGGLNAAAQALRPFTVVRTRGYWQISSDQVVASELQHAALGFCVVSDQAFAAGVASVPTPFAELGSDLWFSHDTLVSEFVFADASGFINAGVGKDFGSKAMRKVEEGSNIAQVIEASAVSDGCQVTLAGRMLVKLH